MMENKTIRVWNREMDSCSMCQLGKYDDCGCFNCSEIEHYGKTDVIHQDCPFSKPLSKEDIESCGFKYDATIYKALPIFTKEDDENGIIDYDIKKYTKNREYWLQHYIVDNSIVICDKKYILVRRIKVNNLPEFKLILKMLNIK